MESYRETYYKLENKVQQHEFDKKSSISLIPTENLLSPAASRMLSSDLVNRYYLTDNTIWEYPQIEQLENISTTCKESLSKLYGMKYVNIRPLSGISCLTVLLSALTKRGQTLYSINPNCGGHGATRIIAERLGLQSLYLPYNYSEFDLDYNECVTAFQRSHPDFIYIDMSNSLFPVDLRRLIEISPEDTFIHYDASQIMGLMLDKSFFNPTNFGCKLLAGSSHKTFPGPQHGMIMSNDREIMEQIELYTNCLISNHHMNDVAALAVSSLEMLEFGADYSKRVRENAIALGNELQSLGVPVVSCSRGVTSTHQVWIDTTLLEDEAHKVVARLEHNNIITNCVRLPLIEGKMTKGIRLGTTDVSRRGMCPNDMKTIAELIFLTIFSKENDSYIRSKVQSLAYNYQKPIFCFN